MPDGSHEKCYALSLKQPWATLLVHGIKTVEVRTWPTTRRGRVLIHASRTIDERPEVWNLVPAELVASAKLRGGILGAGEITACLTYSSVAQFAADQHRHRNEPAWFRGPVLYGFVFVNLLPFDFRDCAGQRRFFQVRYNKLESSLFP